ncbi:hypothetical protein BS50DRAFT_156135 [Corynespora cassiicola Philippines]|uniref:Uncharacterized protein n=1 Tax=Corynespora cassiicola Philippines TaxID=1448308 RepID=A0A2T2N849_CORCC|nr:hypothetical protein BS50DRAFT_156135 [Corynespora cassiicola Philippines]
MIINTLHMLLFTLFVLHASAAPISAATRRSIDAGNSQWGWSNEALFGLLGVCATVICFAVGLAWPRLRTRLRCCSSRCRRSTEDHELPILRTPFAGGESNTTLVIRMGFERSISGPAQP